MYPEATVRSRRRQPTAQEKKLASQFERLVNQETNAVLDQLVAGTVTRTVRRGDRRVVYLEASQLYSGSFDHSQLSAGEAEVTRLTDRILVKLTVPFDAETRPCRLTPIWLTCCLLSIATAGWMLYTHDV